MSTLADLKTYARFMRGLPIFLHAPRVSLGEAREMVRRRLAEREANFLRLLERAVFGRRRSPYLALMQRAGCELGDIRNLVRTHGLEATLGRLRSSGVYVTFEEFKGRQAIRRNGFTLPVEARDFDNPFLSHYYHTETGGTTGPGTRIPMDLEHLEAGVPYMMLAYDAHGVLGMPTVLWRGILPDDTGISHILRCARFGQVPTRWFSPTASRDLHASLKHRLATRYILLVSRLSGVPLPRPEQVRLQQAGLVAQAVAELRAAHGACLVRTNVSKAVRVCLAAQELGLDFSGCTFMGGGEPPTPAKITQITRTGARYVPVYAMAELGQVALGCARPSDIDDVHLLRDVAALVQHPQQVPGSELTVPAFYFTSLLPTAPRLMLNVEMDDYGLVEERRCGCPMEEYGYHQHLRQIRSFRKLSGEGVTLVGSEMVRILEEVLPRRFGGSPLDYQLLEEESEQGFTQLNLLISPRVNIADEAAVVRAVLDELRQGNPAADLARAEWSQAGSLRVKRMEPVWTSRGKLMPLHLARRAAPQTGGDPTAADCAATGAAKSRGQ